MIDIVSLSLYMYLMKKLLILIYVSSVAVLDRRPRPKGSMTLAPAEELVALKNAEVGKSSLVKGPLSFRSIMNSYLGYYFLKKYLKSISSGDLDALECIEKLENIRSQLSTGKISDSSRTSSIKDFVNFCKSARSDYSKPAAPVVLDENTFNPITFICKISASTTEKLIEVSASTSTKSGLTEKYLDDFMASRIEKVTLFFLSFFLYPYLGLYMKLEL